jgi:hypothetical protein
MGFRFKYLAGKPLTLPASFFFILLFPCGSGRNSDENGLWKSEESANPTSDRAAWGAALYTQKKPVRQLHLELCKY